MSRSFKQPYTGSKRFDSTCRNHGSCPYCVGNRMHSTFKKIGNKKAPIKGLVFRNGYNNWEEY